MRPGTLQGGPSPGTGPGVGGTQTDRSIPLLDPRTRRALHLLRVFFQQQLIPPQKRGFVKEPASSAWTSLTSAVLFMPKTQISRFLAAGKRPQTQSRVRYFQMQLYLTKNTLYLGGEES